MHAHLSLLEKKRTKIFQNYLIFFKIIYCIDLEVYFYETIWFSHCISLYYLIK